MKSFLKNKLIFLPLIRSKININRLSTLSNNVCSEIPDVNKDASLSEAKISTLFVPKRHGGTIYQMIKPIIDFNYIEQNATRFENSCKARGIELDIHYLLTVMKEWMTKKDKHKSMTKQYEEFKAESDRLKALDFIEEANAMDKKSTDCLDIIKHAKEELYDMEDIAMPLCAKMPNILDPLAPTINDTVTIHIEPLESNLKSSSHIEIGQSLSLLEFINVSPTAYYLIGPLAELEMSVQVYFCNKLEEMQFAPMSCADFVKSFMLEATGLDPYSYDQCVPLKNNKASSKVIQNLNLVGGSSFQSLCAYLVNMNTSIETLPAKYYSLGRHYEAANRNSQIPSLFNVVQSSNIHCLILDNPDKKNIEFDSMLKYLLNCYSPLKIPFRTVDVAAPRLKCTESRRVQIELWSPALLHYVPVAYLSQHNDFVSKRLHISYGIQHNISGYCNIVEGSVVNIPVLLGCLMENYIQTNGEIDFEKLFQFFDS